MDAVHDGVQEPDGNESDGEEYNQDETLLVRGDDVGKKRREAGMAKLIEFKHVRLNEICVVLSFKGDDRRVINLEDVERWTLRVRPLVCVPAVSTTACR